MSMFSMPDFKVTDELGQPLQAPCILSLTIPVSLKSKHQVILGHCWINRMWNSSLYLMRMNGGEEPYGSNPQYSISPPSSCTAGRIRVSNNSLIIATISESSYKILFSFRRPQSTANWSYNKFQDANIQIILAILKFTIIPILNSTSRIET